MALSHGAGAHPEALANLELLRQRLREALFAKKLRLRELADLCKAQRAELRGWIRQRRAQALKELSDELRRERGAAAATRRARMQEARRSSTSTVELARAAVEIERAHASQQLRITRAHDAKRVAVDKAHARSLSDELMSAPTLKRLAPLLDKARGIRPAPGESRTEALWRYARAHPEEMHALVEPGAERTIAQTKKEIAAAEEAIRVGGSQVAATRSKPTPKPTKAPKPARGKKREAKAPRPHASPRSAAARPAPVAAKVSSPAVDEPAAAASVPSLPASPRSPARRPHPVSALGQGRRGQEPDKVFRSLAAVGAEGQRLKADYRAGKIPDKKMNARVSSLDRRERALRKEAGTPKYQPGDIIEHRTGERAVVEFVGRSDSGGVLYRVLRGAGGDIRDMWHAESIARKVAARKVRAPATPRAEAKKAREAPASSPAAAEPKTAHEAPPVASPSPPVSPTPPPRPVRSRAARPRPQLGLAFDAVPAAPSAPADAPDPPPESARQRKAVSAGTPPHVVERMPCRRTRAELIELLARELVKREPALRGLEEQARHRVTHTVPGQLDTLEDLAHAAHEHGLITDAEYQAIEHDAPSKRAPAKRRASGGATATHQE